MTHNVTHVDDKTPATPLLDSVSQLENATAAALAAIPKSQAKKVELANESLEVEQARTTALKSTRDREETRRVTARKEEAGFIDRQDELATRITRNNQMNPILRNVFSIFDSSFSNQDVREDTLNLQNEIAVFQGKENAATAQTLSDVTMIDETAAGKQSVFGMKAKIEQTKLSGTIQSLELMQKLFATQTTSFQTEMAREAAKNQQHVRIIENDMTLDIAKQLAAKGGAQTFGGQQFSNAELKNVVVDKEADGFRHQALTQASIQTDDAFRDWSQLDYLKERSPTQWQKIQIDDGVVRNDAGEVVTTIQPSVMATETARRLAAEEVAAQVEPASVTLGKQLQNQFMDGSQTTAVKANKVYGENNAISREIVKNATSVISRPLSPDSNQAQVRAAKKSVEDAAISQNAIIDSTVDNSGASEPVAEQTKRFLKDIPAIGGANATKHVVEVAAAGGSPALGVTDQIPFSPSANLPAGLLMNAALEAGNKVHFDALKENSEFAVDLDFNDPAAGNLMLNAMINKAGGKLKPDDPALMRTVSDKIRDTYINGVVEFAWQSAPTLALDIPYLSSDPAILQAAAANPAEGMIPQPHPYSRVSPQQHAQWIAQANVMAGAKASGPDKLRQFYRVLDANNIDQDFHPDFKSAADAYADFISHPKVTERLTQSLTSLGESSPFGYSAESDWKRKYEATMANHGNNALRSRTLMKAERTKDFSTVLQLYDGSEVERSTALVNNIGKTQGVPEAQIDGFLAEVKRAASQPVDQFGPEGGVPGARRITSFQNVILDPDAFDDQGVRAIQKIMIKNWELNGAALDFSMGRMHTKAAIERNR